VAGGHRQDRTLYEINQTASPTVSTTALFLVICVLTSGTNFDYNKNGNKLNKFEFATIDIAGAYLHCDMEQSSQTVDMWFDQGTSKILCMMRPELKKYLINNKIPSRLTRALYGLIEAAKLSYTHLKNSLELIGLESNPYDQCVFSKKYSDNSTLLVLFHVDDLLVASDNKDNINEFIKKLKSMYKDLNINYGVQHTYLGWIWNFVMDLQPSVMKNIFLR
jgi:hypothetical protein